MEIHPTAIVSPEARVGPGSRIGPYAIVEPDVTLGPETELRAHVVVKRYTTLGRGNVVHEGAVLGGEAQDLSFPGGESRLEIGDRNRIREGVTIHRANRPGGVTRVGSDCFLMAYAHVAHDCQVGDRVILANDAALAGHVVVGERAFLGGGAGVHQFCRIGRLAMLGGHAKIVQDCLPFTITDGNPARARALNVVGLRRAGLDAAQIRTLRQAFRLLLRSGLPLDEALAQLVLMNDPLVNELVAFAGGSRRGYHHARPGEPGE